jgi:hypothetical protein
LGHRRHPGTGEKGASAQASHPKEAVRAPGLLAADSNDLELTECVDGFFE